MAPPADPPAEASAIPAPAAPTATTSSTANTTATPAANTTSAPTSPAPSAPPPLRLTATPGTGLSLAAPGLVLFGLAGAALLLARKKKGTGRLVQVLETTALGPKRSLVLARLGDELLLLGSAEGGITLLRSQPAGAAAASTAEDLSAKLAAAPARPAPAPLASLVDRLRGARGKAAARAPEFSALLEESAEDLELRRKLARGQPGTVR
jgi:flagellar biogenesis protein FliO